MAHSPFIVSFGDMPYAALHHDQRNARMRSLHLMACSMASVLFVVDLPVIISVVLRVKMQHAVTLFHVRDGMHRDASEVHPRHTWGSWRTAKGA